MALAPWQRLSGFDSDERGRLPGADRMGFGVGAMILAATVALDVVVGSEVILVVLYAAAPFGAAVFGGVRATVALAFAALAMAIASDAWNAVITDLERVIEITVIALGGLLAVGTARFRLQAGRGVEQLRILNDIAGVAVASSTVEETLRIVEAAVVPSFADFCIIDRLHAGPSGAMESRRYSVSAAAGSTALPKRRLIDRPDPDGVSLLAGEAIGADFDAVDGAAPRVRLVTDVDDELLRRLAFNDQDFEFLRSLGVRSMIQAVLRARGQDLGVISMAVAWSGRRFALQDAEFAAILSGRIALALDNSGLSRDLRSVETSMETAMSVLDEAVIIHDREGRLVFANPACAEMFGVDDPSYLVGLTADDVRHWCRIYDQRGAPIVFDDLSELLALAGGQSEPPIVRVVFTADGREIWVRVRVRSIVGEDREPHLTVTAMDDLTEIKRAEFDQTLLGRTGELLSWSNDYEAILGGLAQLAIPDLADSCAVDVIEGDGSERRAAFAHRDRDSFDPEKLREGSAIRLDLAVGGERAGVVTFANEASRRPLGEADRHVAEMIVERAGVALENARLAAERAEIAIGLQQGLIPPPLPEIPGWEIAAHYRSAGEQSEVGGDFYEAFRIKGGWMIVIGDVTGRGPRAAAVTAQARYTLRTAGILSRDPRAALAALNRALLARPGAQLCSAIVIVLHEGSDRVDLVIAGHPPPLRIEPSGEVMRVGLPGPVLGAFDDSDWPVESLTIGGGRRLVLHTDGITEAHNGIDRYGDERLHEVIASSGTSTDMLSRVEAALTEFCNGRLRDDVALVTIAPEVETASAEGPEIELVKSYYAAFASRSMKRMLALTHEELEMDVPEIALEGGQRVYWGHDGLKACVEDLERTWDDFIVTPRQYSQVDRHVVARGRVYAREKSLGIRDAPMAWLWEVKGGKVTRCTSHPDPEDAIGFAAAANG